jgi:putative endonuclease
MKYYTYILRSEKDCSFYIGFTSDLAKRIEFHNSGKSKYTSKKIPWKLVYFEAFDVKSDAIKREIFLKKQRNKAFYERLIQQMEP